MWERNRHVRLTVRPYEGESRRRDRLQSAGNDIDVKRQEQQITAGGPERARKTPVTRQQMLLSLRNALHKSF